MTMKGIDISHHNGNVDFTKVKNAGYQFVILKAGGSDAGFYIDSMFETNYKKAKYAGLNVGAYYYVGSKCITANDGKADAVRFANILDGKTFEMPVFLDIESTSEKNRSGATKAVIAFCEYMENKGYYVGIYGSDIFVFQERLILSDLEAYDKWVARYGKMPEYVKEYGIWQSSENGKVSGINGNVDLDIAYVDYPSIIKKKHFNNF